MYTIDRINAILRKLGGAEVTSAFFYTVSPDRPKPGHLILDAIDRRVGIITRWKPGLKMGPAPVGERLRRLERHVFKEEAPPFFWLGAQAEGEI